VKWPTAITVEVPILVTPVSIIKPVITETMVVEVGKVSLAASTQITQLLSTMVVEVGKVSVAASI